MPEPTQVTLRYVGPDVDDGSISVDDLLSALNGFSSAFYRLSERESSDQTQRIKVQGISQSSANAVKAGATREEIAETVFIAAALRAGGAVGNGLLAMRLFEEASTAKQ